MTTQAPDKTYVSYDSYSQEPFTSLKPQDFLNLMDATIQQGSNQSQVGLLLSSLAQIDSHHHKMQESLQQITNSLQSNQALQASALVGRKALVYSSCINLIADEEAKLVIDLPQDARNLSILIYNEEGSLLKKMIFEQVTAGFFQFNWDGKDETHQRVGENQYQIEAFGFDDETKIIFKTMTLGNIDSVSVGQGCEGLKLKVSGIGAISLDQVKQISV